ncbi:DUF2577 domain-containing protein [Brevibacillus laterosporus]|uniref:DUF2577 domain-containing protein n=1 Tax=Brevibacillus laterosporus TaxID=1465 RepID=A0AAP3DIQ2_BRELA|nr:DUF2577 domain-containing protein [Brevibacillus laterosporus]MCR8981577.1 DUF2577 domain-containing protein [Brevibacillus laterosporus]MCZ0808732.1 DUF2577 domain-containing protein [Brevibacillus laterosporus]MCZ0827295.1 DUF2577 domain-containing protein [Brevibacillus laterosporus]MCZ0851051.1 DUF2577 domain-containing protein [Brevibacillus laterosporus]
MSLLRAIKQVSQGVNDSQSPVVVLFGTVEKIDPLEVNIEQKLLLTEEFLIIPKAVQKYDFEEGNKLLLLRMQGGNSFVILDRV